MIHFSQDLVERLVSGHGVPEIRVLHAALDDRQPRLQIETEGPVHGTAARQQQQEREGLRARQHRAVTVGKLRRRSTFRRSETANATCKRRAVSTAESGRRCHCCDESPARRHRNGSGPGIPRLWQRRLGGARMNARKTPGHQCHGRGKYRWRKRRRRDGRDHMEQKNKKNTYDCTKPTTASQPPITRSGRQPVNAAPSCRTERAPYVCWCVCVYTYVCQSVCVYVCGQRS